MSTTKTHAQPAQATLQAGGLQPRAAGLRALAWGGLAALALGWPGRLIGPLDGIPLDGKSEAVLLGLVFPVLWWLHPAALQARWARRLIASLLFLKLTTWGLLTQGGWCGTFHTPTPLLLGGTRTQQSWDVRTDWHRPAPRCSAIVARPYESLEAFPVWFINLLGAKDVFNKDNYNWLHPDVWESARPPDGITMDLEGYVTADSPGTLTLLTGEGVRLTGMVDTISIPSDRTQPVAVRLERGIHRIRLSATLSGSAWAFIPLWNGRDLWGSVLTTVEAPTALDQAFWALGRVLTPLLVTVFLLWWVVSSLRTIRPTLGELGWIGGAAIGMGTIGFLYQGYSDQGYPLRLVVLLLFGVLFLPVSRRLQNLRGVFLLLGVPWLSVFVANHLWQIGRWTLYSLGDDWLNYQVFAHRVFMQGYWLEGGEKAFYHQPLYRWVLGMLHLLFGDSSIGEVYWDAIGLLLGALFCGYLVKRLAGFRWGLAATVAVFATVTIGPNWYMVGRGLTEITASAFASLAGFSLLHARLGRWISVWWAGVCGVLMFYTRLNHVPFALGMMALLLPLSVHAEQWTSLSVWNRRRLPTLALVYLGCLALGLLLFGLRTWYYTGEFSVLHGTSKGRIATGFGLSGLLSPDAWFRAGESLLMVMTVQDPPRFDPRGLLVLIGCVSAMLALIRLPLFRKLPLAPTLMCLGGLAFAPFFRGFGYEGRFSLHLIPVATVLSMTVFWRVWRKAMRGGVLA